MSLLVCIGKKSDKGGEMPAVIKELVPSKEAETAQTDQYSPVNAAAYITLFTATNTSGGTLTVSVNLVPNGGAADASNLVVDARELAENETYTFPEVSGHIIASGGVLSTIASGAGITIRCSGVEVN